MTETTTDTARADRAIFETPASVPPQPAARSLQAGSLNPFRALQRHRNFRLFWLGQTTSLVGTWMQSVAQGWLALQLTNDPFMVGMASAAGSLPVALLSLYGGVVADRHDRLRLVTVAQSLLAVQAALAWWMVWSGHATIGWVLAIALLGGTINAFEIPARQSLIIELVGREDLLDAIALNSSGFNIARIIGPAIAGVVIAKAGLAWCFGLNALSYLAVLAGLLMIRLPKRVAAAAAASPLANLREGLRFIRATREVGVLMRLVGVYAVFGVPYLTLMPVIARDTLRGDAGTYGLLLTCVGVGALAAGLALATMARRIRRGRTFTTFAFAFSALVMAFSLSRQLWLSASLLLLVGLCMIVTNALANGLIQTAVPDALRGRVMAAYVWLFVGVGPVLGPYLAGLAARTVGAPAAVGGSAAVTLLYAGWTLARHPELRRM